MKTKLINFYILLALIGLTALHAQSDIHVLTPNNMENNVLLFPNVTEWHYKEGYNTNWSKPNFDDSNWAKLDSLALINLNSSNSNSLEGWFRFKFKLSGDFKEIPSYLSSQTLAAQDIYLNGILVSQYGNNGKNDLGWESHKPINTTPSSINLKLDTTYVLAVHFVDKWDPNYYVLSPDYRSFRPDSFLALQTTSAFNDGKKYIKYFLIMLGIAIGIDFLLACLFWVLTFLNRGEKHLVYNAIVTTGLLLFALNLILENTLEGAVYAPLTSAITGRLGFVMLTSGLLLSVTEIFEGRLARWIKIVAFMPVIAILLPVSTTPIIDPAIFIFVFVIPISLLIIIIKNYKNIKGPKKFVLAGIVITSLLLVTLLILGIFYNPFFSSYLIIFALIFVSFPISLLFYVALWLTNSVVSERANAIQLVKITEEKKDLLEKQNQILEVKVSERTKELKESLNHLKATQSQLIQSEKMASLGELTAGIAHEIQNPLNFVNNFSEVSNELIDEMNEELDNGDIEEAKAISVDIKQNLEKINHHGKRADGIVKGMLQHSRSGTGKKEPTDLNKLTDEYFRLAYHGLRAKDKNFNATLETDFDKNVGEINIIPQDIGRVILNLFTNAFYAVDEKKSKLKSDDYKPTVSVSTEKTKDKVLITVRDNGNGILKKVLDKIFQPFFTTKPTGKGTGLGLSMSYDIIKAQEGKLEVETEEGIGTTFIIELPL